MAVSKNTGVISAYNHIPYNLISEEVGKEATSDILNEINEIAKFYKIYKEGAEFDPEGDRGFYSPARLEYKMTASLINKEARFLFAETPSIVIDPKGDAQKVSPEGKENLLIMQDLIDSVLVANKFEDILIKAAKDCFIGKRVAGIVNFNEEKGITITFLNSMEFIYETDVTDKDKITKFVAFIVTNDSNQESEKRVFKKKYTLETETIINKKGKKERVEKVRLTEGLYDGAGKLQGELLMDNEELLLSQIPAFVILNEGLTGEKKGDSEVDILDDFEKWYSKLSNADIDNERKTMNPIIYSLDADPISTANLPSGPGSFWDINTDANKAEKTQAKLGVIDTPPTHADALEKTLTRIKSTAYNQVEMPEIDLESMKGVITSGKALKAIYWPLIVRCKEKMKSWGPQLIKMTNIIIEGGRVYSNCITRYTEDSIPEQNYEVHIEGNYPLPEDELEEKNMNLSEVQENTMSRKRYMKKWYNLTDTEVEEELKQIAEEKAWLEGENYDLSGENLGDDPEVDLTEEEKQLLADGNEINDKIEEE